jgi:plasmid stabilization system protein ParE
MRLVFGPEAEAELAAAFDYSESVASGLGLALIEDLDTLVRRIRGNPALYVQVHGFMRRAVLRRFPFGVFYTFDETEIRVHAFLHVAGDPRVWPGEH